MKCSWCGAELGEEAGGDGGAGEGYACREGALVAMDVVLCGWRAARHLLAPPPPPQHRPNCPRAPPLGPASPPTTRAAHARLALLLLVAEAAAHTRVHSVDGEQTPASEESFATEKRFYAALIALTIKSVWCWVVCGVFGMPYGAGLSGAKLCWAAGIAAPAPELSVLAAYRACVSAALARGAWAAGGYDGGWTGPGLAAALAPLSLHALNYYLEPGNTNSFQRRYFEYP